MCWSTTQDFSSKDWYVERAPAVEANPIAGSFLFAGVIRPEVRGEVPPIVTGRPVPIIVNGYHPAARINPTALIDIGYPLTLGGGAGAAREMASPDPLEVHMCGKTLEAISSVGSVVRRKVVVRDF
jgi:hypothetical protein